MRGNPHEKGLRVQLGALRRKRQRPDIVMPNVRVRCTKCVLILRTRQACRVIRGALLVSQLIGRSCEDMPISLHGQALVQRALLIMQKTARLTMRLLGGGGANSPLKRIG